MVNRPKVIGKQSQHNRNQRWFSENTSSLSEYTIAFNGSQKKNCYDGGISGIQRFRWKGNNFARGIR